MIVESSLAAGPSSIAERLLEALREPFQLADDEQTRLTVTASIGIATGERDVAPRSCSATPTSRMYRAKRDGKDRYRRLRDGHARTRSRPAWSSRWTCAHALADDEFFLVYQPTFDLSDMSPTGVEALIRWRHPERGVVPARTTSSRCSRRAA